MMFPKEFTYEEMIVSQTAARKGISNVPSTAVRDNLGETAWHMKSVRELLGNKPIIVSSGYRGPEVNKLVGGSDTSAHTLGYAVDFTCPGFGKPLEIAKHIAASKNIMNVVDQLIHEYDSWVHISFDPRNRKQLLTINKNGTKAGLH